MTVNTSLLDLEIPACGLESAKILCVFNSWIWRAGYIALPAEQGQLG